MPYERGAPLLAMPSLTSSPGGTLHAPRHEHGSAQGGGPGASGTFHSGAAGGILGQEGSEVHGGSASSSSSSSTAWGATAGPSSSSMHQIPFNAAPVQHGPSSLTFGFGFQPSASSSPAPSSSSQPLHPHPWAMPATSPRGRVPAPSHTSARRGEGKRRRGSTPESDSDNDTMADATRERSGSPGSNSGLGASGTSSRMMARSRPQQAFPKRMRAGLGGIGLMSLDEGAARSRVGNSGFATPAQPQQQQSQVRAAQAAASANKVDVGKMLATLDKTSLLTLFSRLLSTSRDPSLPDQVLALVPSPSLSAVEASLEESERAIRSTCAHAGEMRVEFAWGRLRNPVADFVSTALGLLPFFVDSRDLGGSLLATAAEQPHRDAPHASTTFAFLLLLTSKALQMLQLLPPTPATLAVSLFSLDGNTDKPIVPLVSEPALRAYQESITASRLTPSNPNTLVSQLLPTLLVQWTRLVDAVSRSVNDEGGMFGSETTRGWLAALDGLARGQSMGSIHSPRATPPPALPESSRSDEERAARLAMDVVRQTLESRIGWLVGGHPGAHHNQQHMSGVFGFGSGGLGLRERPASTARSSSAQMEEGIDEEEL